MRHMPVELTCAYLAGEGAPLVCGAHQDWTGGVVGVAYGADPRAGLGDLKTVSGGAAVAACAPAGFA